ncbi:hypothetical protein Uis1B_2235 [Bifidobacterium margollesii]|uniref:Uncharacterized protein n=1 Tax=Bifidobacterium margollesii TaxID=2020964 RepID=A0A2N5J6U1_9BIFI|nr:hypothetical protein [Bifidobacterium margollesii]PLS29932.1 hypothetical protein Uis1B_2235 [Bifidobacterium margollesii]
MDKPAEPASVTVEVKPDLSGLRAFLADMLAVVDKYDAGSSD